MTIAFTVAQFGLRTRLPVVEVTQGCYIALLGCSRRYVDDPEELVGLALRKDNAAAGAKREQPDVYICSWPNGFRYITMPFNLACGLELWVKEIYISLRPAYREGVTGAPLGVARLMAGSPDRPYEFSTSAIARWEREHGLVLSDIDVPPLPWTGSTPATLIFKWGAAYGGWPSLILQLGRCTRSSPHPSSDSRDSESSTGTVVSPQVPLGEHYATIRYYPASQSPDIRSLVSNNACDHDHLFLTYAPSYPQWAEWPIPDHQRDFHVLWFRRRSPDVRDPTLEVDIRRNAGSSRRASERGVQTG